jgi:formylglycine-generating enzyme required for sulfatase activity
MDMVGNVWEWVEDDWFWFIDRDKHDDGSAKVRDPRLPMRVKRGGSLGSHAQDILTDNMAPAVVTDVYYLGVRCCGSSK